MKKLFSALFISLLPISAQAAKWNNTALEQSAEQLIQQIDAFLAQAPQSGLYQQFDQTQLSELYQHAAGQARINPNAALSYANLKDKQAFNQLLFKLADNRLYGNTKIPYFYLYSRNNPDATVQYDFNQALIYDGQDNTEFAYTRFQRWVSQHNTVASEKAWRKFVTNYGFNLQRVNVDQSSDLPQVCLSFSQVVNPEPLQNWQQFLTVSDHSKLQWQYRGDQLCFTGEWGQDYQIQIDPKLQSEYHLRLSNDTDNERLIKTQVSTGQREPVLRFANNGTLLNAYGERNLTLETANVSQVDLALWQIPANNLANSRIRELIATPNSFYSWTVNSLLEDNARLLFNGHFRVENAEPNKTANNNILLDDLSPELKAGFYVLRAKQNGDDYNTTNIAFALNTQGFTAYKTPQGLWVEVRDLDSKKPLTGQTLTLYAKDNAILATAKTDRNGVAFFAQAAVSGQQGAQPSHVISLDQPHLGYLDLIDNSIDLSNKGLSGELENPLMQSWIWFDRGVYRPNDLANGMMLFKTPDGKPFHSASIWATLQRPDGKTFSVAELKPHANGAYYFEQAFRPEVRLGSWKLTLSLAKDGKGYLAQHTLPVAAILPQQIEVKTRAATAQLTQNQTALFSVQADWLYGAPASGQSGYINWQVQPTDKPINGWQDWQIGLFDEKINAISQNESLPHTNANGQSQFSLALDNMPRSSKPLQLNLQSTVIEPNGQEVSSKLQLPIQRAQPYAALKVNDRLAEIALINDNGEPQNGTLNWKLYRVSYNWYWSNSGGYWQYNINENRTLAQQGTININANGNNRLELPINDGSWVLEVQGENHLTAASLPLEYGNWTQPNINNAPDTISISSDKARYQNGEKVKVRLRAPFDGPLSVKLAQREILENHQLNFKNGEAELEFNWQDDWAQGIWLLANGWNENPNENQNLRAVGLHWLGNDLTAIKLDLQLDLPSEVLPSQTINLPIRLKNKATQPSWLQVAVVDEGLYQLAKASFTDPQTAFYGKKQMNLEMFDIWGNVIKQLKARQAAIRSGAGADEAGDIGTMALPELDIDLLTYWSKPILLDQQGKAQLDLALPQFNGKVRVMAVAWNSEQIGTAEQTLTVKEPLVSQLMTPLFLTNGDQGEAKVRLHNTSDKALQLNVELSANPLVRFSDNKSRQVIKLQPQQEMTLNRTFAVTQSGKAEFELQISGDIEKKLQRFADVRKPALPFNRLSLAQLNGGASWQSAPLAANQGALFKQKITLSNRAPFDPQEVLDYLASYPYGCVEQTASAAWNNLLLENLIGGYQLAADRYPEPSQRKNNLNNAQLRLANLQLSDGSFSLWGNDDSDLWLTAYSADFLLNAKTELAQQSTLNRTLSYLNQAVNNADYRRFNRATADSTAYAYALYVLAKSGESVQGALLRALPIVAEGSEIYPARLFILNGLLQQGEVGKAAQQLAQIAQAPQAVSFGYANYGGALRDYANSMVLLYELQAQIQQLNLADAQLSANVEKATSAVWSALLNELKSSHYFSTQEAHWLAKLATLLPQTQQETELLVNGKKVRFDRLTTLQLDKTPTVDVVNQGQNAAFITLNQWIEPTQAAYISNGYKLNLSYYDLQGKKLDPSKLKLNQWVLLEFDIAKTDSAPKTNADMMLVYPLPAGFKLSDNMPFASPNEAENGAPQLIANFSENRDDRHLAAFTFDKDQTKLLHRVVVRAAQTGSWQAPALSLENMYQPQYRAQTPSATVVIAP